MEGICRSYISIVVKKHEYGRTNHGTPGTEHHQPGFCASFGVDVRVFFVGIELQRLQFVVACIAGLDI
jgi:hypothetical protein